MDFNQIWNLSSLKVINMIGNQILPYFTPIYPILEGKSNIVIFQSTKTFLAQILYHPIDSNQSQKINPPEDNKPD